MSVGRAPSLITPLIIKRKALLDKKMLVIMNCIGRKSPPMPSVRVSINSSRRLLFNSSSFPINNRKQYRSIVLKRNFSIVFKSDYLSGLLNQVTFYRIVSQDDQVRDSFIGYTYEKFSEEDINLTSSLSIFKNEQYGSAFRFMRDHDFNAGCHNWKVVVLEKYRCSSRRDVIERLQHWYNHYDSSLNDKRINYLVYSDLGYSPYPISKGMRELMKAPSYPCEKYTMYKLQYRSDKWYDDDKRRIKNNIYIGSTLDMNQEAKELQAMLNGDVGQGIQEAVKSSSAIDETNKSSKLTVDMIGVINNTGGIKNWELKEIERYPCLHSIEAYQRAMYWYDQLTLVSDIKSRFEETLYESNLVKHPNNETFYNSDFCSTFIYKLQSRDGSCVYFGYLTYPKHIIEVLMASRSERKFLPAILNGAKKEIVESFTGIDDTKAIARVKYWSRHYQHGNRGVGAAASQCEVIPHPEAEADAASVFSRDLINSLGDEKLFPTIGNADSISNKAALNVDSDHRHEAV